MKNKTKQNQKKNILSTTNPKAQDTRQLERVIPERQVNRITITTLAPAFCLEQVLDHGTGRKYLANP